MQRQRWWNGCPAVLCAWLLWSCGGWLFGACAGIGSSLKDKAPEDIRRLIASARDRVFPALVHIHVVAAQYFGGQEHKFESVGSGTIISEDGYVLTNQHVTDNGIRFHCTLTDRREFDASLVAEDPLTDLAVLRLDRPADASAAKKLPVAQLGDSGALQVGELVMAMGSPFALSRSVTLGIVSNPERVFAGLMGPGTIDDMELRPGQRTGLFTLWIQHDASINPGNSGGPLVNLRGEVVGVNELGDSGMGFAIPSNLARGVADRLIHRGDVERSSLGLSFRAIQGTGIPRGVLIDSVDRDSPADRAGLRAGDVLLRLGGEPVTATFQEQVPPFMKRIADLPVGAKVSMTVQRDNATVEAVLVSDRFRQDRGREVALRAWGLTVMDLTDKIIRDRRLDRREGVLVMGVRPGGPAQLSDPPMGDGDIIETVAGANIPNLAAFREAYLRLTQAKPTPASVLIGLNRQGKEILALLTPKKEALLEAPPEVRKAWIGVATQPVSPRLARALGQPAAVGYRVTRIYPSTRAAESDLKVGDIITAIGGEPVRAQGAQDNGLLARKVSALNIGDRVQLTVSRNGKELPISVVLEPTRVAREESHHERNTVLDVTVRPITFFDRDEERWPKNLGGVLLEEVEPGGPAGLGGLMPGDLIQQIESNPLRGLKSFRQAMQQVAEKRPERIRVIALRGARTHVLFLELGWDPVSTADKEDSHADKR